MAQRAFVTTHAATPVHDEQSASRPRHELISLRLLQQILGALWLLDGLLQLAPAMFTTTLITGFMQPVAKGQPGPITAILQPIIAFTAQHLVPVNATIALVQVALGVSLLGGWLVRLVLLASVAWSLGVWIWGEGLGQVLTGQASALTGAPGSVVFYGILGLAAYPTDAAGRVGLLSRRHLQWILAGFWALAAVLQLQASWWQPGQIARAIAGLEAADTPNGAILDPLLNWLAHLTSGVEVPLNIALIVIALGLAIGLAIVPREHLRPLLAVTIVLGLVFWVATQGFGLILTGAATDPNSGPLIVLLALACWPPVRARGLAQARTAAPRASRRVEPGAQRLSFDFALHIGKRL